MKEISKNGIEKLIKAGFIKLSGKGGYINARNYQPVGYYKTCGGHRYIEDFFADKAMQLR